MAVAKADRQTTKFNSPPNFPAIRYINGIHAVCVAYIYTYGGLHNEARKPTVRKYYINDIKDGQK